MAKALLDAARWALGEAGASRHTITLRSLFRLAMVGSLFRFNLLLPTTCLSSDHSRHSARRSCGDCYFRATADVSLCCGGWDCTCCLCCGDGWSLRSCCSLRSGGRSS